MSLKCKNNVDSSVDLKRYYVSGTKYMKHHMVRDQAVEIDTDQHPSLRILDFILQTVGFEQLEAIS